MLRLRLSGPKRLVRAAQEIGGGDIAPTAFERHTAGLDRHVMDAPLLQQLEDDILYLLLGVS